MSKQIYVTVSDALHDEIDRVVERYNERNLTRVTRSAWAERILADAARTELDGSNDERETQ